jgi:uncharacterized membrane protein
LKRLTSLLILLIAQMSAYASRFVEGDTDGSSLPIWVCVYLAIGIAALVHERSPLHEWAEANPGRAFAIYLFLPMLFLFKKVLALVVLIVIFLVVFSLFRGKIDPSSTDENVLGHDSADEIHDLESSKFTRPEVNKNLQTLTPFFSVEKIIGLGQPTAAWPYVDVCIYFAKNFTADDLMSKVQAFRTKIGLKYPGEFDPPEWMSFDFLSDDYPREQEIYDILFDYIIDGQYPNCLVKDGLELTVAFVAKALPVHMTKFFKPLELLTAEEYEEAVFSMAMYKAMQMIKCNHSLKGVNLQYGA